MHNATVQRHRFSVTDYHRLIEAQVLHEDDRVELIEGEIITMTPVGSRHVAYVNRLTRLLTRAVPDDTAMLSVQNPLRLSAESEPQPDIALLRASRDDYEHRLPGPSDVLLVIEVAESSLAYDQEVKSALYAAAGIPEFWLVDILHQVLEVYTEPETHGYNLRRLCRHAHRLAPTTLPECMISLAELFVTPAPEAGETLTHEQDTP